MTNRRIAVRAIITHDNKILAVRQKPYNEVSRAMGGAWCTPGGGLDPGEALKPGLERELFEETGIKPEVGELLFIQQFSYKDTEQFEFFFHVRNGEAYLSIDLSKTSHGVEEIEEITFVDPASVTILPKFLSEVDIMAAVQNPRPTRLFSYL